MGAVLPEQRIDKEPPESLLLGRRALEELPFCRMTEDWTWYAAKSSWALGCRLRVEPRGLIPELTDWYFLVEGVYPWGKIEVFPAKERGIVNTFKHQSYNSIGDPKVPWRTGKICVQTSLRFLGRRMYDAEPYTAPDRLSWYVSRAHEWLVAASLDKLVDPMDPFELPDFPTVPVVQLAFVEDENSFGEWSKIDCFYGIADFAFLAGNDKVLALTEFKDAKSRGFRKVQYGDSVPQKASTVGIWVRLPNVPLDPPWQAPASYGELVPHLETVGFDLEKITGNFARNLRDGKPHPLALGFPIPSLFGGPIERYHWQGIMLPVLSHGKQAGFRTSERGYRFRDKTSVLTEGRRIDWVPSSNCHLDALTVRGRLPKVVCAKKVILIGAGALGSMVSDLLVRQGCRNLLIVDGEKIDIGNLNRHTLTLSEVGKFKASSLADRLRNLSPQVQVSAVDAHFPALIGKDRESIGSCDLVLDCTGDDTVLYEMSTFGWKSEKIFFSISVGLYARRLFLFACRGDTFPHSTFSERIQPWIRAEVSENENAVLPREGMGCWHPIFPAPAGLLWIMAGTAVEEIERLSAGLVLEPQLIAFEQVRDGNRFEGLRRVSPR